MKKETRGGARPGSGRPQKEPTKTLSYRVPEKLASKIDKAIRKIISSMSKSYFNNTSSSKSLRLKEELIL